MDKKIEQLQKKFITKEQIIKHNINSYNHFIQNTIKQFIKENEEHALFDMLEGSDKVRYFLKISNPVFSKPELKEYDGRISYIEPIDAIMRNLSYVSKLHLSLTLCKRKIADKADKDNLEQIEILNKEEIENNLQTDTIDKNIEIVQRRANYEICEFPIMVGSILDPYKLEDWDLGGYFIIKGAERILLSIEEIGRNFVFHSTDEASGASVNIYSSTENVRFLHKVSLLKTKICLSFQPINVKLNILPLIKYIGYTDKDILENIGKNDVELELMLLSYLEQSDVQTIESCKQYLIKNFFLDAESTESKNSRLDYIVDKYLLIHLGDTIEARPFKAQLLCEMTRELLLLNTGKITTKMLDSYEYKRIKTPGYLLEDLFKFNFNRLLYNFKEQLLKATNKSKVKLFTLLKTDALSNTLLTAISTGNWVGGRQKITAILDRTNMLSAVSNLRKIISPLLKTQQHIEARIIDPTHRGRIDPIDTPHGLTVGLVKSLALGTRISEFVNEKEISYFLKTKFQRQIFKGKGSITLNEKLILTSVDLNKAKFSLSQLRLNKTLPIDISIDESNIEKGILNINTEIGRVMRPLLVVKNKSLVLNEYSLEQISKMSINDLLYANIIQYLDVSEEKSAIVSYTGEITENTTHVEINPSFLFGYLASSIPFLSNNSASRASLGQKLIKQATTNYIPLNDIRPYARNYSTTYLQKPIVSTTINRQLNEVLKNTDFGVNIVVAVTPLDGFNMEDAIIVKRESIERGLLFTEFKKAITVQTLSTADEIVKSFRIPDKSVADLREPKYYSKLDEDGLTSENTLIENNEAIAGKVNLPSFRQSNSIENVNYTDASIFEKTNSITYVNSVTLSKTKQGANIATINLREPKLINIGDKLSSRYGQKGVVGSIKNEKDLPFSQSGIVPDIFISPHGFPSRLTFGHTLEMLYAKIAAISGKSINLDYGQKPQINKSILESIGLHYSGNETFYNPNTGKELVLQIYTGISYYLRLEHIVDNKIYARAKGPVQILTRQPTEGKQKEGGLRLGEMERDALIAYGASDTAKERLNVDLAYHILCNNCHLFVEQNHKGETKCMGCKSNNKLTKIKIPFAFKLLVEELNACNIKLQFKSEDVL